MRIGTLFGYALYDSCEFEIRAKLAWIAWFLIKCSLSKKCNLFIFV